MHNIYICAHDTFKKNKLYVAHSTGGKRLATFERLDFDVGGICKKNKEVSKIVDRPSPAARRQQNL
jgi:hypothetical protein